MSRLLPEKFDSIRVEVANSPVEKKSPLSSSMSSSTPAGRRGCFPWDLDKDRYAASSPALSCFSSGSHLEAWAEPSETVFILDWDDTLCPTTALFNDSRLKWEECPPCFSTDPSMLEDVECQDGSSRTLKEALEEHSRAVQDFLRNAAAHGHVVIVTLAMKAWYESSVVNYLPGLSNTLEELGIEVFIARDFEMLDAEITEKVNASKHRSPSLATPRSLKRAAMMRSLQEFYGRGGKYRSWKNIVSIGDSDLEHEAVRDIISQHEQLDSAGKPKKCRCKCLKMVEAPQLRYLTSELQVLQNWLWNVAQFDGNFVLDFDSSDGLLSLETPNGQS